MPFISDEGGGAKTSVTFNFAKKLSAAKRRDKPFYFLLQNKIISIYANSLNPMNSRLY